MSEEKDKGEEFTRKTAEVLALPISLGVGFMFGQNNVTGFIQHNCAPLHEIEAQAVQEALPTLTEKWKCLPNQQKQSALISGIAAAGITFGALLTVIRGTNILGAKDNKNR